MRPIYAVVEDTELNVIGCMIGSHPDSLTFLELNPEDVCQRQDLASHAAALCAKYQLQPSPLMQQALAGLPSTPPPPSP